MTYHYTSKGAQLMQSVITASVLRGDAEPIVAIERQSTMINVGQPRHLTSYELDTHIESLHPGQWINDAAAVTIASWWQSSGDSNGLAFTALAQTGRVALDDLLSAIQIERASLIDNVDDGHYLVLLAQWADVVTNDEGGEDSYLIG